jgi:hypothetical protein
MRENNRDLDRRTQSLKCSYYTRNERNERTKLPAVTSKTTTLVIRKLIEASKCRRVKFGSVETIQLHDVPPASQMTMKERGTLWWSRDDFKSFKSSIKIMSKSMRYRPEGAAGAELSYASTLGRVYAACVNANTDDDIDIAVVDRDLLIQWARNAHCRRGLERRVVRSIIKMEGCDVREKVIYAVNYLNSNPTIDQDIKDESINTLCTRMTRPARLFAQCLALVDAECVTPNEKEGKRLSHRAI